MFAKVIILLAAVFAFAACNGGDARQEPTTALDASEVLQPTSTSEIRFLMERTVCEEGCPQYEITVQGDGTVHYLGGHNVDTTGLRTSEIPRKDVGFLLESLKEAGFDDARSNCRAIYDGSWTIFTLQDGETEKKVYHCAENSPLAALGHLVDEVVDSRQWIGLPEKVIVMNGGRWPGEDEEGCTPWPCTTYSLVINKDGRVEFEGFRNVDVIGTRTGQVTEEALDELVDAFVESGFFELPPDFHCQGRGLDSTTTAVFLRTRSNGIERCQGARPRPEPSPDSPLEPLRLLQVEIAKIVELERWVGEENLP